MKSRRIIRLICIAAAAVAALCLGGCADANAGEGADAGKPTVAIENAIRQTNERIQAYKQTDAAFADTLMYYLPGSCVYDCDDGYLIRYKDKNYTYAQELKESDGQYTFYSTVEEALTAQNETGVTLYTLGYNESSDGGCARYIVDENKTSDVYIKVGDVYLNYMSAKNKVSLRQMGWKCGDCVDYQKKFEGFSHIDTLIFGKGEYPFYDAIRTDRCNVNYFGIDAVIYTPDGFGGTTNKTYNALWSVRKSWSSTKIVVGQTYSGLDFEMRQKRYNEEIADIKGLQYLMQIAYCEDIKFYNCSYTVPDWLYDGDLKKYSINCFDCFSAWHNILFDGCRFENNSYANEGGAIAFRDVYNAGCEDLVFTNNTVISSPRDETVALFAGWDKRNHLDNPVLGAGYIKNCRLEGNTFIALDTAEDLDPRTMFLTVGYQLSPVYNINYINNTFEGYCNSFFLHYCYCHGLNFKGNTVNIRQTGNTKKMNLIYHNDSPEATDIVVENNVFNLLGDNFQLSSVTVTSPYSDGEELTFRNNVINLPEGHADKLIASSATVKDNVFNIPKLGSIYYRTCGDISGNTYNIETLEKAVFEFYNADVKHDLVVKQEKIDVEVAQSNMLSFNGTNVRFNGHSLLFEDIAFDIKRVDKDSYHISWLRDEYIDGTVPVTFRRCTFGAYDGHLQIVNGEKVVMNIDT